MLTRKDVLSELGEEADGKLVPAGCCQCFHLGEGETEQYTRSELTVLSLLFDLCSTMAAWFS